MISKETLKHFENIDFDIVKQYLPAFPPDKLFKLQVEELVIIVKEQYEKNSIRRNS